MSLYTAKIVNGNPDNTKRTLADVKKLCRILGYSYKGDLIIDMYYLPQEQPWHRWRCMV